MGKESEMSRNRRGEDAMDWRGSTMRVRTRQLDLPAFDPMQMVKLRARCVECGEKHAVGVWAHVYYSPGWHLGDYTCGKCVEKRK
jgi:ribosomal protein L44E